MSIKAKAKPSLPESLSSDMRDGVAILTLTRPHKRNAIDEESAGPLLTSAAPRFSRVVSRCRELAVNGPRGSA